MRSLEEPLSHSACPGRLRRRAQAVPKSLISLRLTIRPGGADAPQRKMLADMADGLRHLYLFTWLERDVAPPPEVRIADLYFE